MKKTKKISRRGEIDHFKNEDHFKKVNEINSPFRSQQITGSPHHTMSKYLPKYANEPNEHYIIISQKSGKKIAVGVGSNEKIPKELINEMWRNNKQSLKIHLHNHPNDYPTPSIGDDNVFRTINIVSRSKRRKFPDKVGVISKNSAMILTYPDPFDDDKPIPIGNLIEQNIKYGYKTLKNRSNFISDDDNIKSFDDYRKIHGIEKETINFDKPLYMSRKRKTVKPKTKKKRKN